MNNDIPTYSNSLIKHVEEDIRMKAYYAKLTPLLNRVISLQKN